MAEAEAGNPALATTATHQAPNDALPLQAEVGRRCDLTAAAYSGWSSRVGEDGRGGWVGMGDGRGRGN